MGGGPLTLLRRWGPGGFNSPRRPPAVLSGGQYDPPEGKFGWRNHSTAPVSHLRPTRPPIGRSAQLGRWGQKDRRSRGVREAKGRPHICAQSSGK